MTSINPLELFLWTFRRKEKDVINLYNTLSDVMRLATGGDMLNFGYWQDDTTSPLVAQNHLCSTFGKMAKLQSGQRIIDVGSGLGAPALNWYDDYSPVDITCVNINFQQLKDSKNIPSNFVNSTATLLPFENQSVDRVLAFESAQHFKPLRNFLSESSRILKDDDGLLALAIPVMVEETSVPLAKLGILSMTWSSEHYSINHVKSLIKDEHYDILEEKKIGSNVYDPLADYYTKNRDLIKSRILKQYPAYVENILFKSITKMKQASQKRIIDYLLITCKK